MFNLLNSFGDLGEVVVPLLSVLMLFGIPIVAILTGHQRKMAEIIHNSQNQATPQAAHELMLVRQELAQMRDMLYQQTIRLDTIESRALGAPVQNQPIIQQEHTNQ